jgi:hypothetical protein
MAAQPVAGRGSQAFPNACRPSSLQWMTEAATSTGAQLGPVGGRILLEVFNGLLDSDEESYRNLPDAQGWTLDITAARAWNIVNS